LESRFNELWLSPINTWEVIILVERGRVVLETDPITWLRSVYTRIPFKEAPINHEVAIQSRTIDLPHQDPADRFLAATAVVYGLTLVTADARMLLSKVVPVLPNKKGVAV
jgi:PIN domain nuclease of toxin-antitoxin system